MATSEQPVFQSRSENLAFVFQNVITATTRLRTNRQTMPDADIFRAQVKEALAVAEQEARTLGYAPDAIRRAIFATVVFLDESALNQQLSIFGDWARKPLQEELFGVHVGGEIFFENLRQLLAQTDSTELADVLEVYQLCLLLGYRGRFGLTTKGDLDGLMRAVEHKIRRIRGFSKDLSPHWAVPQDEKLPSPKHSFGRILTLAFVTCFILTVVLYTGLRVSLRSEVAALTALAPEARK